jgi:hypothetical protein
MSEAKFKVGDRVEFVEDYARDIPQGTQGTVLEVSDHRYTEAYYSLKVDGLNRPVSPYEYRLKLAEEPRKMSKFKKGDRVVAPAYGNAYGVLTVDEVLDEKSCFPGEFRCIDDDYTTGIFTEGELERVSSEAVEAEPEAQPVHYRICVGTTIGTTEYPTQEAALDAAKLHGDDGEQFSIFEVVKIADYRVKVEKSLEAV